MTRKPTRYLNYAAVKTVIIAGAISWFSILNYYRTGCESVIFDKYACLILKGNPLIPVDGDLKSGWRIPDTGCVMDILRRDSRIVQFTEFI